LGNYTRAEASCHQALTTFRNTRHADGQAATLDTLGYIAHASGRPAEAVAHYRRSLTLRREQEQTSQVADTLEHLGHPYLALGQYDQTRAAWSEALHLYLVQGRQVEASRVERQLEAVPEDGRTR
jgi:tetratricopeptide (TPR) repeat protein